MSIGITEEEENKIIDNFFFLVFTHNPETQKVRLIIDGGALKTSMKKDKFVSVMYRLCQIDLCKKIDIALLEYGGFYLVDRSHNTIRPLLPAENWERLGIKEIHDDVLAEVATKDRDYKDDAINEYDETVTQKLSMSMHGDPGVSVTRGRGFINYNLRKKKR